MSDLRISDAPLLQQDQITGAIKVPTGGNGNYAIQLSDLAWYVANKENLTDIVYVDTAVGNVNSALQAHVADTANPHQVTKAQVGLDQVNNTADLDKPVSNATRSAIIAATTDMATKTYVDERDSLKADISYVDTKVGAVSGGYFVAVDTLANLQAKKGMTTGQVAKVMSDPTASANGDYYYNGTAWVKGYDALTDAKVYTDSKATTVLEDTTKLLDGKVVDGTQYTTEMMGTTLFANATIYGVQGIADETGIFNVVKTSVFSQKSGTVNYRVYLGSEISNGMPVNINQYSYSGNFVDFPTTYSDEPHELRLDNIIRVTKDTTWMVLMQHSNMAKFNIYHFTQSTKPTTLPDTKFIFGLTITPWSTIQKSVTNFVQAGVKLYSRFNHFANLENKIDVETTALYEAIAKKKDRTSPPLLALYDDLQNPLMSVNIKLIGDSITWGRTASNNSEIEPRNFTLADVRNTTDPISPSWANLLRNWLIKTYLANTALVDEGNGRACGQATTTALISKDAQFFSAYSSKLGKTFSSAELQSLAATSPSSSTGEYFDIASPTQPISNPTEISFYTNGTGVTLVHAKLATGSADTYKVDVYIDDTYNTTIYPYASTNAFNTETAITLSDDGKHKITLKNVSTSPLSHFRLQGIKVAKKIRIANDGIIGSTTNSWLNTVKLADTIKRKDDYVFVMLGTNDRGASSTNNSQLLLAKNLRTIIDNIYTLSSNNAKVILMSANAVTQDETRTDLFKFGMADVNAIVKNVADDKKVSFISNYAATTQLKIDAEAYLADGLHPNDYGHRVIFNNIKQAILNS